MILYLNKGLRNYLPAQSNPYVRNAWELVIVLNGGLAIDNGCHKVDPQPQKGWICGPTSYHFWISDGPCEILVWHFSVVTELISQLCPENEFISYALSESDLAAALEIHRFSQKIFDDHSPLGNLKHDKVMSDLSLLFLEHEKVVGRNPTLHKATVVDQICSWYSENLSASPSIADASRCFNLSTVHLRRLFHEVKGASPKSVFDKIRYEKAKQFLVSSNLPHYTIAELCGFQNATTFSRGFHSLYGFSPRQWVDREVIQKKHTEHHSPKSLEVTKKSPQS